MGTPSGDSSNMWSGKIDLGKATWTIETDIGADDGAEVYGSYANLSSKGEKEMYRAVMVVVLDEDERLTEDQALIYQSDVMLTRKSDNELKHEIGVLELLKVHNEKRTTEYVDEEVKRKTGKEVYLPPVKFSDLTFKVVRLANL